MRTSKLGRLACKLIPFILAVAIIMPIQVQEAKAKVDIKEFPIGIYWPPTPEFTTAEQYDYIAEAGINVVEVPNIPNYLEVHNDLILDLVAARGMKAYIPAPPSLGSNALWLSDEELEQYVNLYKDHPGLGGYFIWDEPQEAWLEEAARVYKKIAELDPDKLPHVNMLPFPHLFQKWVDFVGADKLNYLETDFYPYTSDGKVKPDYYSFLDTLRKTGLKNNVKTSNYLQSVGIEGYLERPKTGYLRHNVYSNLAYGVKALTWFTWWSPGDTGVEKFTDAIMNPNGEKTDLFAPVKELNKEIKALGPTLLKLDAMDVYHSGGSLAGLTPVPADFFFKPTTNNQMIISHMVDSESGRNYIMVASKNRGSANKFSFALDPSWKIKNVTEVSKKTGKEIPTDYNAATGVLTGDFAAGEGKLYAMDAEFNYRPPTIWEGTLSGTPETEPEYNSYTNLALGKPVIESTSYEADGWSMYQVTDGITSGQPGWSTLPNQPNNFITINLNGLYQIDEVKLYPSMSMDYFPIKYHIDVSEDNTNWTTVVPETSRPAVRETVTHNFEPISARYVKVVATEVATVNNAKHVQLMEVEVFARHKSTLSVSSPVSELLAGRTAALSVKRWNASGQLEPLHNAEVTFESEQPSIAVVDPTSGVVTGVSTGTANIKVTVKDLITGDEESVVYRIRCLAIPKPWTTTLAGGAIGAYQVGENSFTITSTGNGIGSSYASIHQPLAPSESVTLTGTIRALHRANDASGVNGQAGLLVAGDSPDKKILLSVNAAGKVSLTAGSSTITGDHVGFPAQLALVKHGNQYTGYYKKEGKWLPIHNTSAQSTVTYEAAGELDWGVANYSSSNTLGSRAEFSELSVQSGAIAGAHVTLLNPQMKVASEQLISIAATTADGYPTSLPSADYSFTYTSDNPEVAAVSAEGIVSAVAEGKAKITVVFSNAAGTVAETELLLTVIPTSWDSSTDRMVYDPPIKVFAADFLDLEDQPISQLAEGNIVRVRTTVYNVSDQDQQTAMIAALYGSNGEMVDLFQLDKTVSSETLGYTMFEFTLPAGAENNYLKLFIWDSLHGMRPLSDVLELHNEAGHE